MLHSIAARITVRASQFRDALDARLEGEDPEAGNIVSDVVVWAGLFLLAVGVIVVVTNLVTSYTGQLVAP